MVAAADFRARFLAGETLIGTFVKTPSPHVVEILGAVDFDFIVIDAEHAPFDRRSIDMALLAARAAGVAAIVRTADCEAAHLLAALDDGAVGVLVPHINSADEARRLVSTCRYGGQRGYSNSPRAGGYGATAMWDHVDRSDALTTVIAMIEDPRAVQEIDEILAGDGLDGVFVGRADLAVSLGDREKGAPQVCDATALVAMAARRARKPVMLFVANSFEARTWSSHGVSSFIVSSDQSLLKAAALHA